MSFQGLFDDLGMLRSILITLVLVLSASAAIVPAALPWDTTSPGSVGRRLAVHLFCLLASVPLFLSIQANYSRRTGARVGIEVLVAWGAASLQLVLIASTIIYSQTWRANLSALQKLGDADVFEIDGALFLEGVIGVNAAEAVSSKVTVTRPHTLVLDSPGGLIETALKIAQVVKRMGLPVHVSGTCASACVIIASASPKLSAKNNAVFGFHRGSAILEAKDSWTRFQSETATDELIAVLQSQGIPQDILAIARQTAPNDMYWVGALELYERGVVVQIIQ